MGKKKKNRKSLPNLGTMCIIYDWLRHEQKKSGTEMARRLKKYEHLQFKKTYNIQGFLIKIKNWKEGRKIDLILNKHQCIKRNRQILHLYQCQETDYGLNLVGIPVHRTFLSTECRKHLQIKYSIIQELAYSHNLQNPLIEFVHIPHLNKKSWNESM